MSDTFYSPGIAGKNAYFLALALAACAGSPDAAPRPGDPAARAYDEIVVCGERFHAGTPVVLWTDPGGYDAYRVEARFGAREGGPPDGKARYGTWRRGLAPDLDARVRRDGWRVPDLAQAVGLFVLHYDVCGTSRQCFKVLQDVRGLSVHFLCDVDGTLYQTLDLRERAWHAGEANDRSIGVEIAQIGAYGAADHETLRTWYGADAAGPRITFPATRGDLGIRTPGFVARPARPAPIEGRIHGERLWQWDFTPEQYAALARLAATLHRVLGLPLEVPRDAVGQVRGDVLTADELAAFRGVCGHWHLTTNKTDPGPAMDWDRLLAEARALVSGALRG